MTDKKTIQPIDVKTAKEFESVEYQPTTDAKIIVKIFTSHKLIDTTKIDAQITELQNKLAATQEQIKTEPDEECLQAHNMMIEPQIEHLQREINELIQRKNNAIGGG